MQLTPDFSRVAVRTAAETVAGEPGPKLGEVAELLRTTISKEFGVVPPNLNTALDPSGTSMTIMAVDRSVGLNVSIVVSDLNPPSAPPAQTQPAQPPAPGAEGMPPAAPAQAPVPGGMPPATPPGMPA